MLGNRGPKSLHPPVTIVCLSSHLFPPHPLTSLILIEPCLHPAQFPSPTPCPQGCALLDALNEAAEQRASAEEAWSNYSTRALTMFYICAALGAVVLAFSNTDAFEGASPLESKQSSIATLWGVAITSNILSNETWETFWAYYKLQQARRRYDAAAAAAAEAGIDGQ